MPRLRNPNTLITHWSQLSEGDKLVSRGTFWDIVGSGVSISCHAARRVVCVSAEAGVEYVLDDMTINNMRVMKISFHTYARLKLERAEYHRSHGSLMGYRTGLFPCLD